MNNFRAGVWMISTQAESFASLRDEWNLLLSKSSANTIFSTWEWQNLWWNTLGQRDHLHLRSVRSGTDLVGILPLRQHGGNLSLVGGEDVSDYLDIIAARGHEDVVYEALLSFLEEQKWELLDLHCLREGSPTLSRLTGLATAARLKVEVSVENVCPAIDLPVDWEMYIASLSKKDRHELRRKLRRLEESGQYRWYSITPSDGFGPDADLFLRLGRQSREEKAAFLDEQMESFFRNVIQTFGPTGILKIFFLEFEGRRVSSVMCFDQNQERWLYNSGYDPSLASLSVGLLLKAFCIKDAIASGKRKFDFLRGREPYKYDLGGVDVPIFQLQIRPS